LDRRLPPITPRSPGVHLRHLVDTAKGNRPSFTDAAAPEEAEPLYERFCTALSELGIDVAKGRFGARMAVQLVNDGPVTIVLDTNRG
jgi:D-tyrosyl-tRNA(Tyr) deacylase